MRLLLDTNVLSELRKPAHRIDTRVSTWAESQSPADIYLSAITILEIELGILRVSRRDSHQGLRLRAWLEQDVLDVFAGRILPVDTSVARQAALLHVPDPRPERDALIGATAAVHGLTVATRNVADFEPMGISLINPWVAPAP